VNSSAIASTGDMIMDMLRSPQVVKDPALIVRGEGERTVRRP
jgi:hypothetical protein